MMQDAIAAIGFDVSSLDLQPKRQNISLLSYKPKPKDPREHVSLQEFNLLFSTSRVFLFSSPGFSIFSPSRRY